MDWATRKVLAWRLSNTMEADFCIETLEDARARYGAPGIFNTDQGSQFTTPRFAGVLEDRGTRISMDGRCLHRAPVALPEIRMRRPACIRDRIRITSIPEQFS